MSTEESREALRAEIARRRAELSALDHHRAVARDEVARLETELAALDDSRSNDRSERAGHGHAAPETPAEKVALFRSLFRGRDDVHPRLWTNSKSGRTGYAPACANEWVRGVCEKPRVRCGECPNQAFTPVSDQVIADHLQGRHVLGVYPLLLDETCWFIAADFDKANWMADTGAFRDACDVAGLSVHVERSRSGNGAHAWFFFESPVPAATARRMACFLLTQAMSSRHDLAMSSYDRLFPNQDTMPTGGFGNLIALPLQHEPRRRGNTVFIDETFRPYPDQWMYLANIERVSAIDVERIAADARRSGQVLGVRPIELDEDPATTPWRLSPSRRSTPPVPVIGESLPEPVRATLAQRLFVNKDGLPSSVLNALKRIAAFQNPEFYKKQSMRLSTALTPRVVACAEDFPEHVAIPRGCVDESISLFRSLGSTLEIDDQRQDGRPIDHTFRGTLTDVQEAAVRAMRCHDIGILVAPPGIGKTVAGIYLIAKRARSTLVLVHRQPLLDQWIAQLALFLDVDPKSIGRIGGGKRTVTGEIDVAMLQSVVRKDAVADLVAEYGHVVVDECHHVPAVSFERVLSEVRARYVTGLTATPRRRDGQHPIIEMQLGPARYVVEPRSQAAAQAFQHRLIVRKTEFDLPQGGADYPIQRVYQLLSSDHRRNDAILDDIIGALEEGRSPIVLTERKDHLDFLADRLRGFTRHLVVLKGGSSAKRRQETLAGLAAIPATEERIVLATGRYVGEGFDDARLDTLFLTMPVSWRGTLIQYAGRLHRSHPGKAEVRIYDYVDDRVPVLARMYERRLAGYRSIGYESDVVPQRRGTGESVVGARRRS